jgi:hypothetical protein
MPNNIRHGRFAFFRSPSTPGGTNTTIPGSTDLGTYQAGGFSRLTGIFSTVGSMTLRYSMGCHGGNYQVTSSVAINSGGTVFDVINLWPVRKLHHHGGELSSADVCFTRRTPKVRAVTSRCCSV